MPERLEILTLGGLRILVDGSPVRGLASRKAEALVVYLALQRGSPSREALATLLWDDRSLSGSLSNLSVLLTSLRKHLGGFLRIERESVSLDDSASWGCDAEAFERQVAASSVGKHDIPASEADHLETALGLYRGPFLEGFFLREARGFEEWGAVQRERLRMRAVEGHRALAVYGLRTRQYPRGLEHAQRALSLDPLSEAGHRTSMLLWARQGEMARAIAQYQVCRDILGDELGVDPSFETTDLYHRLRSAAENRSSNLPIPPTTFVGREPELHRIAEQLADHGGRLLTIIGPGGAGKTRLAIEAASRAAPGFLHGVCFVPLAPLDASQQILPALAQSLGFAFRSDAGMQAQLTAYLRERELLLILDGVEHVAEEADLVGEWLELAPDLRVIATSRAPLRIVGEWLLELGGLPYPASPGLGGLADHAAVELFRRSAARARSGFTLTDEDLAWVIRICRRVDGLPLALEMAGAWMSNYSVREVSDELERSLDFLAGAYRDLPERQASLRAVFEHTWRQLKEEERDRFCRLCLFRGGFTREAAERVAAAASADLATLVDRSLLHRTPNDRYETHEVLRVYGMQMASQNSQADHDLKRRFRDYYGDLLNRLEAELAGRGQAAAVTILGQEQDNLRAAWQSAVEDLDLATLERGLGGLARFYMIRGLFQEGADTFAATVRRLQDLPPAERPTPLVGKLMARTGSFLAELSNLDEAQRFLQEAWDLRAPQEEGEEAVLCLNRMGIVSRKAGFYAEAQSRHGQALAIARKIDSPRAMADSSNGLGSALYFLGRYEDAQVCYREALTLYSDFGDDQGAGRCLINLANIADRRGDFLEARSLYERSLSMSRRIGDRWGEAAALNNLGNVLLAQADYRQARALYAESLAIKRDLGHQEGVAASLDNLGRAAYGLEEWGEARRLREGSLAIRREIGDAWGIANSLTGLGDIALALGDETAAEEAYRESLQTALDIRVPMLIEAALVGWAELAGRRDQAERALEVLAVILSRGAKDKLTQARADRIREELSARREAGAVSSVEVGYAGNDLEGLASSVLAGLKPPRRDGPSS